MTDVAPQIPAPPARSRATAILLGLTVAAGFFMDGLDSTALTTALPEMARSLGESPLRLSMAITSYLISVALFIPVSGWIADRFGARDVFCAAILLFTIGSALCGLADSFEMLVATRVIQGMGGAMMTPVGRMILLRSFPPGQLVRAMTWLAVPGLAGPMMGPLVGGFLTTHASWRWIFYVNIPIGLLGILLAARYVENFRAATPARFDFRGFLLAGCGLVLLQLGFDTIGRGAVSPAVTAGIIAAACLSLWAYRLHARRRTNAVIDLRLLNIRTFSVGVIFGGLWRTAAGAIPFLTPLMLQLGLGYDPLQSGSLTFVSAIGAMTVRAGVGVTLRRFGFRSTLLFSGALGGVMMMGFALIGPSTPYWAIMAYLFAYGFARSISYMSITTLSYGDLTPDNVSRGSSFGAVVQQMSQSCGVALGATLLALLAGPGGAATLHDFSLVFVMVGVAALLITLGFLRLEPGDGAHVSHHRPKPS